MPLLEDLERLLTPAELVRLSDWMEANVVIPPEYKRPGPLVLEDWQWEPIDAMLDPPVRILVLHVVLSQSLKTTSVNCRLALLDPGDDGALAAADPDRAPCSSGSSPASSTRSCPSCPAWRR